MADHLGHILIPMARGRPWTKSDTAALKKAAMGKLSVKEIARRLGRAEQTIRNKASQLRLSLAKLKSAPEPVTRIQGQRAAIPASVAAPAPPSGEVVFTLEEIKGTEPWDPDTAQRFLTLLAQRSPKVSDQIQAATKLLDSRRKDGGGSGEHDEEWEALRRDPVAMEMLREMAERRRAAEKQVG